MIDWMNEWMNEWLNEWMIAECLIAGQYLIEKKPFYDKMQNKQKMFVFYLSKIYQEHFKTFSDAENLKNTIKS